MSLYALGQGFNQGVDTGTQLYDTFAKGRNRRGMEEAGEILAEMQYMGPDIHVQPGAVPESEGDEPATGTPVGFDGQPWNAKKAAYLKALSRVTDARSRISLEDQLADLEKEKVMGHGRMAMAAIANGDMESAQRHMAGISYYTDPDGATSAQVLPNGNVVYDTGDGPMMLTAANLEEFLAQFEDFGEWRQLAFDKERFAKEHKLRREALTAEIENNAARLAATEARYAVQNDYDRARIAQAEREAEAAELAAMATADKETRERFTSIVEDAWSAFDSYWSSPEDLPSTGKDKSASEALIGDDEAIPMTQTQLQQEAARENTSMTGVKASALRNIYESNPLNASIARTLMAGLAAGGDIETGGEIAEVVRAFIVEPDDSNFMRYDPDEGLFYIGGVPHAVGQQQQQTLAGLYGTGVERPALQGIPETGATP